MEPLNLYAELEKLLRMDSRFCTEDGVLLKNRIVEAALALNPELLTLLLSHERLKRNFFTNVAGVEVFDKVKFQHFVMNKSFLPDSYTSFKNKIGLTGDDGHFLSESREVVLAWPYKDCVLEGGQTKEDVKRQEVFYNTILAPDEINRLTEPKVLTNFKRYDKDGAHEVTTLSPQDNLIIKGNNLLALYTLKEKFAGKVKLIYIDPPYNTGNDSFGYNDSFNHSTWLTFMKNRLEVAHTLLKDDGLMFIHIDDIEEAYLKVLTDEVFGREHFINVIAIRSSTPSGTKTAHKDKTIIKQKDLILVYKKSDNVTLKPQYTMRKKWDEHYSLYLTKMMDGTYHLEKLIDKLHSLEIVPKNQKLGDVDIQNPGFKAFYKEYADNICRLQSHKNIKAKAASLKLKDQVYEDKENGIVKGLYFNGQVVTPLRQGIKTVYTNRKFDEDLGVLLCDFWDDIDFQNTQNEGGTRFPTAKKPEMLLHRLLDMCTVPNDIVMDFYLGSGTTAAVAHKMKRRYIGIEQLDYGVNDSVVRLQNVIAGEKGGISPAVNWQGGGSFVYCELVKSNQLFVDEITRAETTDTLQDIWKRMQETGYLSWKIKPAAINAHAADFKELTLEEQKRFLMELLDENLLYIPYSEVDNKEYHVAENDKQLNRLFYAKRP